MSKHYEAPAEVRQLEKMLNEFTYRNGYEISRVFDDWLEYMIWAWSLDGKPIEGWKYKEEGNKFFYDLLREWAIVMDKQIQRHDWYDAFGDLFMACVASKSRKQGNGQFFTPPSICDLIASINPQKKIIRIRRICAAVVEGFNLPFMCRTLATTIVPKILTAHAA